MFELWSRRSVGYSAGEGSNVNNKESSGIPPYNGNRPRRVKTQQVVEVIGGCRTGPTVMRPSEYRREIIVGPPKLPRELIVQIVHLTCQTIVEEHKLSGTSAAKDLLYLARIDKPMHSYVLSHFILQSLRLRGVRQIHSFANSLNANILGIQDLALKVRRLYILRPSLNSQNGRTIFNDTEELAKFQRIINSPLRKILEHCINLDHLALEISANALDIRWPDQKIRGGIVLLSQNLKELTTMLTIYGGDLNENLFDRTYGNPNLQTARWTNLTHLQLDGPRLRINSLTVLGLCELPNLTHLAIMMPWIVHTTMNVAGISPDLLRRHAKTIERATDLTGRENILQLLYSGLGHQLKSLYLICHDIDDYVGNVKNLGPWFRALQWHEYVKPSVQESPENVISSKTELKLIIVSLGKKQGEQIDPHPVMISYWMMQRVLKETHWTFEDGEKDEFEGRDVSISVESWKAPSVPFKTRTITSSSLQSASPISTIAPYTSYQAGIDDLD